LRLLIVFIGACVALLGAVIWLARPGFFGVHRHPAGPVGAATSRPAITDIEVPPPTHSEDDPISANEDASDRSPAGPVGERAATSQPAGVVYPAADPEIARAERVLASANEALRLDPGSEAALSDAIDALKTLQRWDEAAKRLAERVALHPDDAALLFDQGATLLRAGRWHSATLALQRCLELKPDDERAWYDLAIAYQGLRRLSEAHDAWNRVLALAPDRPDAFAHRAEVLLDLQRWDEAAPDLEAAVQLEPESADLRLNLALAYWKLGREADARRQLHEILAARPRYVPALNRLAEMAWAAYQAAPPHAGRARLEQTIACCRQSLAIDPDQPDVQELLQQAEIARAQP